MNYKDMKLEEIVEYTNTELAAGRNFTEIAQNDFSCNESTLRKRLTAKKLYKRIGNKYVRQCQTIDDRSESSNENNNVRQDVTDGNIAEITGEIKSQSITVSPSDKEKFLELISNYELIMNMLDDYKNKQFTVKKLVI